MFKRSKSNKSIAKQASEREWFELEQNRKDLLNDSTLFNLQSEIDIVKNKVELNQSKNKKLFKVALIALSLSLVIGLVDTGAFYVIEQNQFNNRLSQQQEDLEKRLLFYSE
jgi:hypothetical protein